MYFCYQESTKIVKKTHLLKQCNGERVLPERLHDVGISQLVFRQRQVSGVMYLLRTRTNLGRHE